MEYFNLTRRQVPFLFAAKESSNLGLGKNREENGPQDWETSGNQREKALCFWHQRKTSVLGVNTNSLLNDSNKARI